MSSLALTQNNELLTLDSREVAEMETELNRKALPTWEHILLNLPTIWNGVQYAEEQALVGNLASSMQPYRRSVGTVSDPTGNRAMGLAEARDMLARLEKVRQWIDSALPPADRALLINVWRYHYLGWPWVARHSKLGW